MRTTEQKQYYARCVHPGCEQTWSGRTPKQILKSGAAARSHCQQASHRVKVTVVRKAVHIPGRRKAAK